MGFKSSIPRFVLISSFCAILLACLPTVKSSILKLESILDATATKLTYSIPSQVQYSTVEVELGTDFNFKNICQDKTIFGRTGYASCMMSNGMRTLGGTQLSQVEEVITYAATGTDPALPSQYHEVPIVAADDDGQNTTDLDPSCSNGCTPILAISSAQHTAFQSCGTTQSSIANRIADCASVNGAAASWSGKTSGVAGESSWKLVTQNGLNQEVWQDQRTKLLWSTIVGSGNWCQASGNVENSGVDCNTNTQSFCVEILSPAIGAENWVADTSGSYTYSTAKGGLGRYSTPAVRWRLPTVHDYEQANIDGIRFVMPDMGALNTAGQEWDATIVSNNRTLAWTFYSGSGQHAPLGASDRVSATLSVRCVGR